VRMGTKSKICRKKTNKIEKLASYSKAHQIA